MRLCTSVMTLFGERLLKVLFNYDWLHAKLSAMSIHDVLADFDAAIKAGPPDAELGLLASALRVGGPNIGCNANSLAFDLLGRLLVYYDYQAVCVRQNSFIHLVIQWQARCPRTKTQEYNVK